MKKFTGTYDYITSIESLLAAWRGFAKGKKQHHDVAAFYMRLTDNLIVLQRELHAQTYLHGPYKAFPINDPKPRAIHKALVRDRVVHHLLYQSLYQYFDRHFIYDSYSCRDGKGTHRALERFATFARTVSKNHTRTVWVLKCDIRKFFASIDHLILKQILERHIKDGRIRALLAHVIDSFHTPGKPGVGLPLGNLTSQLLVNIYMNEFDQWVKRKVHVQHYVRYADDFVFLHEERTYLEKLIPTIETYITDALKLSLHPDKVSIATFASGIDFLGWVHFPDHRVLRETTKRRMLKRLDEHVTEAVVQSYVGLLSHGDARKLSKRISYAEKCL